MQVTASKPIYPDSVNKFTGKIILTQQEIDEKEAELLN